MKKMLLISLATITLSGCAATAPINAQVMTGVIASPNPAPKQCKYITQVVGSQGNFFTGAWTSNANLEQGAMNDLKNKTLNAGGNYVQIVTNRAGATGSSSFSSSVSGSLFGGGSFQQTNVTSTGNVYKCPPSSIGLS